MWKIAVECSFIVRIIVRIEDILRGFARIFNNSVFVVIIKSKDDILLYCWWIAGLVVFSCQSEVDVSC